MSAAEVKSVGCVHLLGMRCGAFYNHVKPSGPSQERLRIVYRGHLTSPALGLRPLATFSSVWPEVLQKLAAAFAAVDWKAVARPVASNTAFPVACVYLKKKNTNKPRAKRKHCAMGLWAQSHGDVSCGERE